MSAWSWLLVPGVLAAIAIGITLGTRLGDWTNRRLARRWLEDWYHDEGMLKVAGCAHCEEDDL